MVHCFMCKSSQTDDIKYGKLIKKHKIYIHYFCLFLTSNLLQNGKDNQGIFGFLLIDIQREAERISEQICCYCGLKSAGIGCCDSKCRRIFHLICGIENGALNQFSETYRSFCHLHLPKFILNDKLPSNITCSICYDNIIIKHRTMCFISPCCKNGWFHKYCLQEFANKSGYFFKCPLCNNNDKFRYVLARKGVFVPDQDAAWELEPNAFSELLERPNECSALKCLCSKGRKYTNTKECEIIFCDTCGSQGIHILCYGNNENDFNCNECIQILSERNQNCNITNAITNNHNDDDDENEFIVVDDCDDDNGINAAHAFRISINNHPLANEDSEDFENVLSNNTNVNEINNRLNITNFENINELDLNSNICETLEHTNKIYLESDDDDEIIQLRNIKRRKIINDDSDDKIDNKNMNKIITRSNSRSQSSDDNNFIKNSKDYLPKRIYSPIYTDSDNSKNSPILRHRTRNSLKKAIESSDDNVPLKFLVNNTIKVNEKLDSVEKIENKNINKIITRSHSRSESSDDINFVMNNSRNINRRIYSPNNKNTKDNGQNTPILQHKYRTRNNCKTTIESSEDNVPLNCLTNRNSLQNNSKILNGENENIIKELNIENNISNEKLNIEENSNIITTRRRQSRLKQLNDKGSIKNKYCTRSKSQCASTSSTRDNISLIDKTPSHKNYLSRHTLDYQCENSESSLSSVDINLKEKYKRVLEDNAKKKQTPINRNIPSSSLSKNRLIKSRFIKLKTDDDSISSSSLSSTVTPNTNSDLQFRKLRTRLLSTTSEYRRNDINSYENNNQISPIPVKNSNNNNLISNKSNKSQSNNNKPDTSIETNSDSASSNILSESLQIENDSDSDGVFTNIIKNINNKENTQCKNISNKSKNRINININDELRKTWEREYIEVISITIEEERLN